MIGSFDFDLRSLEIFVYTVEGGNMTTAAEQLGSTQSAVSQTLTSLEKSLEVKLLDRSVRPLQVTTAGRFLYDSAKNILQQAHKTNSDMRQTNFSHLNHVNIAMVDSLVTAVGPSLIDAVKKHTVDWSITTGLSHRHANALMSRKVDIILSDDALDDRAELMRYRILREPFILVAPKNFNLDPQELSVWMNELGFIRYSNDSLIGITIERYLRRMLIEPDEYLRLDNTFAILSMVSAGLGWTVTTPLCLFKNGILNNEFSCYPLPGDPLFRNLILAARHNELWELPKIIAADSQAILQEEFLSYVRQHLNWLESEIEIG